MEAARREAARIGGEFAGVDEFLRHHAGAPHGAAALADELDVDAGYELAVAAAFDGRLRAAVVEDRAAGARCWIAPVPTVDARSSPARTPWPVRTARRPRRAPSASWPTCGARGAR